MTGKQTPLKDTDASAGRQQELLQQPLCKASKEVSSSTASTVQLKHFLHITYAATTGT